MSVFVWEGGNKTMPNMNYPESDWKLFRSKISDWQEAYMEKLCKEYIDILSADGSSADRFWAVEERIKEIGKKSECRLKYGAHRCFIILFRLSERAQSLWKIWTDLAKN